MKIIDRIKSYVHTAVNTIRTASTSVYAFGLGGLFNRKRKDDAVLVAEGYVSNTDTYSIVKRISENGAEILPIFQERKGGEFQTTENEKIIKPILDPLHYTSYTDWLFEALVNLLNTGDLFLFPSIPAGMEAMGTITEYRVLESAAVTIKQTLDKKIKNFIYLEGTQQQETFEPEQIIHIKYVDPSLFGIESKRGLSALQAGYLTLTADTDTEAASAHLLKNKGAAGFLTDESEADLDDKDAKTLQDDLDRKMRGATNFGKIRITQGKFKYVSVGMSPSDLKTIENQVLNLRRMCNLFSVNSALFNDPENKRFNNVTAANEQLFQDAVLPAWNKIFRGIQKYLRDVGFDIRITPNTSTIACLQKDKLKESQVNSKVTEAILKISENIAKNSLTLAAGQAILVHQWGFSEDEAKEVLQIGTNENG